VSSGCGARGRLIVVVLRSSSRVRSHASEGGGIQVERPQPEARTNDLDVGAGWRMLDVDDVRVQLSARVWEREVRTQGSLGL
jgi:hypothetical protein